MKTQGNVTIEVSATEALMLARLVRQAERKAMRQVDPDFVPGPGQRDAHLHQARTLGALKARILTTIDAVGDDIEPWANL